jgi:hypothetical protein
MTRSKKIFAVFGVVFVILLAYASYDIATRTTFPGSKPQLKERIQKDILKIDSITIDTLSLKN